MPLTHETATALDPQAKAVIDLVIKSGRPPYHHLSPKDARQMFRETRPASTPAQPKREFFRQVAILTHLLQVLSPSGR